MFARQESPDDSVGRFLFLSGEGGYPYGVADVPQMGYTVVMNTITKTAFIRARVEPRVKREAEAVLRALGVDTTSAVTMFLKQISLRKGIPFAINIPNATTIRALNEKLDKHKAYKDVDRLMADILAGK